MNDHRFDVAVRALAQRASRRGALRGLIAVMTGVLAVSREAGTTATHARISLGGACYSNSQCRTHAATRRVRGRSNRQAVYCAANGFSYDGPYNCCRNRGGSCRRDEHCCGSRYFCRSRVCTYLA